MKKKNLLVYVNNGVQKPAGVNNVVVGGTADKITLVDATSGNNNFYCPQEFTAKDISYTHDYQQETVLKVTQGWETLTLPFDVQQIVHESGRKLQPFGVEGDYYPFWLMELGADKLEYAQTIEANKPYVISMPNNKGYYADEYNQNGKVTFSAQNATVPVTDPQKVTAGGNTFVPVYQLELRADTVFALNIRDARDEGPEGSVFLSNYRDVRPFEVYMPKAPNSSRKAIALRDLMNGETTGILEIQDMRNRGNESWYTLDGRKLQGKPTAKGLYIQNGRKVVVR